jgi:hypothetical protein
LKFKTNQAQDVKKVEKLNNFFVRLMSAKTVDAATAAAITAAIEQEGVTIPLPALTTCAHLVFHFLLSRSCSSYTNPNTATTGL